MKISHTPRMKAWLLAGCGAVLLFQPAALATDGLEGVEAVASKVSKDYVRIKMADGSFQNESYAFGPGGNWGGEIRDLSIEKLNFMDVARVIAVPLATQRYVPARDPKTTRLLIMVYWGTTAVPPPYEEDPIYYNYLQALDEYRILLDEGYPDEANNVLSSGLHQLDIENRRRDLVDFRNAGMIGYAASGLVGTDYGKYISHNAIGVEQRTEVAEIEENRYFVVLMAYDFQLLWKQKKRKLLWETRFSINERHNQFDKALPLMAQYAARFFGQPSDGLVKARLQEGRVEIGDPTLIEFLTGPKK
jgi:hypothetical protein